MLIRLFAGLTLACLVLGVASAQAQTPPCNPAENIAKLGPIAATHTMPPYPPISRRLDEQGVTVLRVDIGPDGVVVSDNIERSSGSMRLDLAALGYVKANWRWQPLATSCSPIAASESIGLTWTLLDAPEPPGR